MAAYTAGWMTYGHLQADCLYTGISSGPNARYRVWEVFTFLPFTVHNDYVVYDHILKNVSKFARLI